MQFVHNLSLSSPEAINASNNESNELSNDWSLDITSDRPYRTIIVLLLLAIVAYLLSEIVVYFWHRWLAHSDIIANIHATHKIHHQADAQHEAHEDFIWSLLILLVFLVVLCVLYVYGIINIKIATYLMVLASFYIIVNWYIHAAYHQKDHWLQSYAWFRQWQQEHYVHHVNPQRNYGIVTRNIDKILSTYQPPEYYTEEITSFTNAK